jgi:hypothetical protein
MLRQAVCNAAVDIELMESEVKSYVASMVLEELEKKCRAYDYELLKAYEEKRSSLKKAFSIMHLLPETNQFRVWLEDLLRMSMTFAQSQRDELYRRRHNSFVMRYVLRLDIEAIAKRQKTRDDTIRLDTEHVLDKMMVFAFGIDGVKPELNDSEPRPRKARQSRKARQIGSDDGTAQLVEVFANRVAARRVEFLKAASEVIPEFDDPVYANLKCHAWLSKLFSGYSRIKPNEPSRRLMDQLMALHRECVDYFQHELLTRRHEIFKLKYTENLSGPEIADLTGTSAGTVYLDVQKTIRDMMLLAFGMKQVEDTKED